MKHSTKSSLTPSSSRKRNATGFFATTIRVGVLNQRSRKKSMRNFQPLAKYPGSRRTNRSARRTPERILLMSTHADAASRKLVRVGLPVQLLCDQLVEQPRIGLS